MNEVRIMDAASMKRSLLKIAYEILARNKGPENLAFLGLQTRGIFVAKRIAKFIEDTENVRIPVGVLDVTMYRDDFRTKQPNVKATDIPFDVDNTNIVLIDDVFFTGRTIRAALDAIMDYGRPRRVRLAVLIDRGNREMPVCADYIGKTIKTQPNQEIRVRMSEVPGDGADQVDIVTVEPEGDE